MRAKDFWPRLHIAVPVNHGLVIVFNGHSGIGVWLNLHHPPRMSLAAIDGRANFPIAERNRALGHFLALTNSSGSRPAHRQSAAE